MNDEERTSPIGLARYAREYFDAAIAADREIGERSGYEVVAPAPVMFLVAHAIELALKAYLRWRGASLRDIQRFKHDIEACWTAACDKGLGEHLQLSEEERDVLRLISRLHSSTELRYIKTGYKEFPVFGPLQTLATKLLDAVCPLVGYK